MKFLPSIFVIALVGHCAAECPASHEELPTLYDDQTFNCAVYWAGEGDDSALNSCIDCEGNDGIVEGYVHPDGWDQTDVPGRFYNFGSFLVKPGCTYTVWQEANYEGEFREFDGTLLEAKNDWGYYWSGGPEDEGCAWYGWASYKCRCQQKMLVNDHQILSFILKFLKNNWFCLNKT